MKRLRRLRVCGWSLLCLGLLLGCAKQADWPTGTTSERAAGEASEEMAYSLDVAASPAVPGPNGNGPGMAGDRFSSIVENSFVPAADVPLSTFSIDVDTAAYAKTRVYLTQHHTLPPPDSVRIEELVNYFEYDDAGPADDHPFSVHVEVADAPWRAGHRLARVALRGREIEQQRPASNLVFLLDVSGSMDYHNKLPLVKEGLRMLTSRLGENDRVAIVVYAGAAGLVLPATTGDRQSEIVAALDRLHAGGSTNGGQGVQLAYDVARQNFVPGGVNRVILCSDGDFNVGVTSTGDLVRLAERRAAEGIYLSVLGFGVGNHNDAMLEELSNRANGNYAFIDTPLEARKVLLDQMDATLVTIAKDVKIQVEFNPARVSAYRLIGYENRRLEARDFNDDRKDAGEIGAGHSVTALYELVPAGEGATDSSAIDPLKYQSREITPAAADELMTVKLRYKRPDEDASQLLTVPVPAQARPFVEASTNFRFAAAVAEFGMLLRGSAHRGDASYQSVLEIAESARGADQHGYRAEFLQIVAAARELSGEPHAAARPRPATTPSVVYAPPLAAPPVRVGGLRTTSSSWFEGLGAAGLIGLAVLWSGAALCSVTLVALVFVIRAMALSSAPIPEKFAWPCTSKH